ncbi:hypothetical protein [Arthrobacter sp. NPDC089319]|uniref:hypothetical protein n=1 Tax=Arthrobacter sp. NPDC089319 TaxID=3155915 RepID=UPI0034451586
MTTNSSSGSYDEGVPVYPAGGAAVPPPTTPPTTTGQPRSETAKTEAKEVGREGVEAGQHVAQTAKGEAKQVAHEAKEKARDLMSELGDDVRGQAHTQQQRVASGLRSIGEELSSMARNSDQSGTATHLVSRAADRADSVAHWLENRDPGSLLDEVKRFARQRPGAFLAIAAGAGVLAGRLTKGLTADSGGTGSGVTGSGVGTGQHVGTHRATAGPVYATPETTAGSYEAQSAAGFGAPGAQPETTYPVGEPPLGGRGTAIPDRNPYEDGGTR